MTQLNTPYPATAYLTGFLRQEAAALDVEVAQADASIELFLRVFSRAGVQRILDELRARAKDTDEEMPPSIAQFLAHGDRYVATVDSVVRFLQGSDPGFALRVVGREHIPLDGPAILVCNHVSFIDWLIIASGSKRPPRFVMYHGFLKTPLIGWIFRDAKVIPIAPAHESEETMAAAFDRIAEELEEG